MAEGPDYAALYGMLRMAAGQLQHQATNLSAEQRQQLVGAALRCCAAVTAVPDDAIIKFCDIVYYLTYSCATKVCGANDEMATSVAMGGDFCPFSPLRAPRIDCLCPVLNSVFI